MRRRFVSFIPTLDQMLSSATAPLFLLIAFMILTTKTFALTAQFIFLYGCLASICQAILGEPYLIAVKQKSRIIDPAVYTSASILLAVLVSIASFPLSLLITDSLKLSIVLILPSLAMLIQDSQRIWRISNRSWSFLLCSDASWLLASVTSLLLVKQSDNYFLFFAWGVPGCIALLIILDYGDFRSINLLKGWDLLIHFTRRYYYTVVETTLSGVSLVIAYWAISNYLGDSEISLLRYASLFFGLSTIIINRQRIFDFASEQIEQLEVTTNLNTLRRIKEIWRVVILNLIFLFVFFALLDLSGVGSQFSFPGVFILLVLALDRLSVGLLMAVTVFYKTHKSPKVIAKIRTLVALSSSSIYALFAILDSKLELLIILGTLPYVVAFGLIYRSINKATN